MPAREFLDRSFLPTFLKFDLRSVFDLRIVRFVIVFLFIDMFDTIGTLVGVTQQAGLIENGRLPRGTRAMAADATGWICGACLGTSTVTSYIESAAGVEAGERTGLTAICTGILFLIALGLVAYVIVNLLAGRREVIHPVLLALAVLLVNSLAR